MTEIKYKLVDGEPVCSAEGCPMQTTTKKIPEDCHLCRRDAPCIPGLRQQRDEARAVIEKLEARIDEPCDDCATIERDELRAAIEKVRELKGQLQRRGDEGVKLGLQGGGLGLFTLNCPEVVEWLDALLTPAPTTGKDGE